MMRLAPKGFGFVGLQGVRGVCGLCGAREERWVRGACREREARVPVGAWVVGDTRGSWVLNLGLILDLKLGCNLGLDLVVSNFSV